MSRRSGSAAGDAGQVVGDRAHAVPGVDEHRQAVGRGAGEDLPGRRCVHREVLRPRMQLDPAVPPVAAALVLRLPRAVRVQPHERDEAVRGRAVRGPDPVVGHPEVGALLRVVERKDHRAVDVVLVEVAQQVADIQLAPVPVPTHVRVRVPDRRGLQHPGRQATQIGVRVQRHARLRHGGDLEVALVRDPVRRHHLIVAAPTQRRSVRTRHGFVGAPGSTTYHVRGTRAFAGSRWSPAMHIFALGVVPRLTADTRSTVPNVGVA